jgi:hypothetical protein
MRRIVVLLALALSLAPLLRAQEAQPQGGDQEQKPTLGPKPGPGESGPRTATVNDYRKLVRIRTLYVERMDNDLNESLMASLGKLGRFKMASNSKEADAIVRGSCLESRRLKRLHTEVSITDRGGGSIWQDVVLRPYNPPSLAQAVNDTAQAIAEHLGESINQAGLK